MRLVNIFWYLSVLFLLILIKNSFATVLPGHEAYWAVVSAVLFGGTCGFAVTAVLLNTRLRSHWIRQSTWVRRISLGFAAVLTVLLLLGVAG